MIEHPLDVYRDAEVAEERARFVAGAAHYTIIAAAILLLLLVATPLAFVGTRAYFNGPYLPDYTVVCYPTVEDMYEGIDDFDCRHVPDGVVAADVATCNDFDHHHTYAHPSLDDECPRR